MASFSEAYAIDKQGKRIDAGFRVCWRYDGKSYQRTVATRALAVRKAAWVSDRVSLIRQGRADAPPEGADVGLWFMSEGKQGLSVDKGAENGNLTLGTLVGAYLGARKTEWDAGSLSATSYSSDVLRLRQFQAYCDKAHKSKLADVVTADFLTEYRNKLLGQIAKGKASAVSVKHILRTAKACLAWGYKQEKIEVLPRVLADYAKVTLPPPAPEFFTVDEIQSLYGAASPRTRLYVLLGLNLGYTQADIASLEHGMIDWSTGIVTRKRQKTGCPQSAKLWPVTVALLREQMTDPADSAFMLRGEQGNPLIVDSINAKGNPIRIDAVRLAFNRVKAKLGLMDDPRGFAIFRKTSAENIAKANQDSPHLVDRFWPYATVYGQALRGSTL